MPKLLVSVRSSAEAALALAGGADVIDVKEPRAGALGAADPQVWRQVHEVVGKRAVMSAALGELLDDGVQQRAAQAIEFRFAKIGLAGCGSQRRWRARWHETVRSLPIGVEAVPVAYADWQLADALPLDAALALASESAGGLLLIDTHDKGAGALMDHLAFDALEKIVAAAHACGVGLALAGSLDAMAIQLLTKLAPAYMGVRGAACAGGRDGAIDLARVKSLARLVHSARQKMVD